MNHVFKKIWSKSLGCIVVVAENAKSAGKTNNVTGNVAQSSTQISTQLSTQSQLPQLALKALVVSIMAVGSVNTWAGVVCDTTGTITGSAQASTAIGDNATSCGVSNKSSGISDATKVAAFKNAAKKGGNIAIGRSSTAVGVQNLATAMNSSVFGSNSQATATNATAIGNNSLADVANTVSVGRVNFEKRITNVADLYHVKVGRPNIIV